MLIKDGFVFIRNQQSLSHFPWWKVAPWRWRNNGRSCYEVAQFLHNLPPLIYDPEFTESDLRFLNNTQSFFKRAEPKTSYLYGAFFSVIRQFV